MSQSSQEQAGGLEDFTTLRSRGDQAQTVQHECVCVLGRGCCGWDSVAGTAVISSSETES